MTESLAARALRRTPVVAAVLLVAALAGCADMAGIGSEAKLRDAASLGLAADRSAAAVPAVERQWWLAFGDAQLNTLIDQAAWQTIQPRSSSTTYHSTGNSGIALPGNSDMHPVIHSRIASRPWKVR